MGGPLLLISVDGLGAALLDDPRFELPSIRALGERGVRTGGVRPVFPSVTWPCHSTLITGVSPARHGVLGNVVLDRPSGAVVSHYGDRTDRPIQVDTLCHRAVAVGLTASAICWPKTRGMACLADNIPEFYEQELFERYASPALWAELREAGLPVHRYGEWSRHHPLGPMQDWLTARAATHLIARRPPDCLLVHFLLLDSFQHDFGVGSPEARWAARYVDDLVGQLVRSLDAVGRLEATTVVVLGDHGFVPVERLALPNAALATEGLLRLDDRGTITEHAVRAVGNGGAAHVYVAPGPDHGRRVAQARERLSALPGVAAVFDRDAFAELGLPEPKEDPTQGDLMLTAAPGWHFGDQAAPELVTGPIYLGTHGHLPDDPRLFAGLVAAGPAVGQRIRVGTLDALDVAPTLAAILGVTLPEAERAGMGTMLAPAARVTVP
jgi:predicted AlkP superfamily pyrophosphatase or phosphodiesterase